MEKNAEWLKTEFIVPFETKKLSIVGRPKKAFNESSKASKRRKVEKLIKTYTASELLHAAKIVMQKSGNRCAAQLINDISKNLTRASQIKKALKKTDNMKRRRPVPYTVDEALCIFLENDLTKHQYQNIRISAKKRNSNIYLPYNDIINAKKLCYPDDLYISESACKVSIQNLLNHTASRIIQSLNFKKIELTTTYFEMLCKWGCDGSSGQAQYKQKFDHSYATTITDSDIFLFSLVPLQLRCSVEQNIVWENPRPSSTRFCRPIKFCFKKETIVPWKK